MAKINESNEQQCRFLTAATSFWRHELGHEMVAYFSPKLDIAAHLVTLGGAAQKFLIIERAGHFRALNEGNVL